MTHFEILPNYFYEKHPKMFHRLWRHPWISFKEAPRWNHMSNHSPENSTVFEYVTFDLKQRNVLLLLKIAYNYRFGDYYTPETLFNVKFLTSRVPLERMHFAVQTVFTAKQGCRIFPVPVRNTPKLQPINK